jgi:hypothetical protein
MRLRQLLVAALDWLEAHATAVLAAFVLIWLAFMNLTGSRRPDRVIEVQVTVQVHTSCDGPSAQRSSEPVILSGTVEVPND